MHRLSAALAVLVLFLSVLAGVDSRWDSALRLWSERVETAPSEESVGTRWAILIAGSSGFWNYRHQVDASPISRFHDFC